MNPNLKNQYDALSVLWKGASDNFNMRRGFEFKYTVLLWTAYAFFISVKITTKAQTFDNFFVIGVTIIGGLLLICHAIWLHSLAKVNNLDRKIARYYEKEMMKLTKSKYPDNIQHEIDKKLNTTFNWSHIIQITITLLLYLSSILSLMYFNYNRS